MFRQLARRPAHPPGHRGTDPQQFGAQLRRVGDVVGEGVLAAHPALTGPGDHPAGVPSPGEFGQQRSLMTTEGALQGADRGTGQVGY